MSMSCSYICDDEKEVLPTYEHLDRLVVDLICCERKISLIS
jgi:hypothetical protein